VTSGDEYAVQVSTMSGQSGLSAGLCLCVMHLTVCVTVCV